MDCLNRNPARDFFPQAQSRSLRNAIGPIYHFILKDIVFQYDEPLISLSNPGRDSQCQVSQLLTVWIGSIKGSQAGSNQATTRALLTTI